MDEKARLRQFYLRILLGLGITWGCMLFITAPFIFRGKSDTTFEITAVVANSLTLMPASLLAFWHRRLACVWLTCNAVGVALVAASYVNRAERIEISVVIGLAVPIFIALVLDITELAGWPTALD